MKVLFLEPPDVYRVDYVGELVEGGIDIVSASCQDAIGHAGVFDVLIGARIPREFLMKSSKLRYVIIPFAGIPVQDRDNLREFDGITVINSHFNKEFVAEHTWALLLASARKLAPVHEMMRGGDWSPRYEHRMGVGLEGKCLLILGYGAIGRVVGRVGKAFGMKVVGINRGDGHRDEIDHMGTTGELHDLLPEADFIVVILPLTEETRGIIGYEEFQLMKDGVHIINVGRGPLIDEEAFYNALKSGKIGGAALDTWWIYPPDEDSVKHTFPSKYPLYEFDNLVFSPHRSTHVLGREKKRAEDLACILNDLSRGIERNVVDIAKGY